MGRIEDLLTLEAAGQLPDNMKADLDVLRKAGEIPQMGTAPAAIIPEESTLTKYARKPAELVEQLPYIGKAAAAFVPRTPAGWGGLAGLTAASILAPQVAGPAAVAKYAPTAIRAGASALGAMGGSVAGGEREPIEVAKEGGIAAGGQLAGEAIGKAVAPVAGYVGRQLKGGSQALLDKYGGELAKIIPGIGGEKMTPTRFFDVVVGGKGDEALHATYKAGVDKIKNMVGPNAFIQNPEISAIVQKYLPNSDLVSNLSTITAPLRQQGATAPAHLVLGARTGTGQPISVDNAIRAAEQIALRSRMASNPNEPLLGLDMREANTKLRQLISNELNSMAPGAGDIYKGINTAFRKGITVLSLLKDNAEKIFQQQTTTPKINSAALARVNNMALADLRKIDAEDLAAAARRGAPPGAGDVSMKIPGTGIFFGGSGVRGRLSESPIAVPAYAGTPGGQVSPNLSGSVGQLIAEWLKRKQQQPTLEESLGITK